MKKKMLLLGLMVGFMGIFTLDMKGFTAKIKVAAEKKEKLADKLFPSEGIPVFIHPSRKSGLSATRNSIHNKKVMMPIFNYYLDDAEGGESGSYALVYSSSSRNAVTGFRGSDYNLLGLMRVPGQVRITYVSPLGELHNEISDPKAIDSARAYFGNEGDIVFSGSAPFNFAGL